MTQTELAALNDLLAIPGVASVVSDQSGLPKLDITTPAANAEIYLHGAHVTSWQPAGFDEILFVSKLSHFEDGKAIRGGIPICFPWFRAKADNPKAPAHGFVRTREWKLESIAQDAANVVVALTTASDDSTRAWWPFDFRATHRITVGTSLKLELIVENTGSEGFQFEEALHTYNRVSDSSSIRISGLDEATYLDNRNNNAMKVQSGDIRFTTATDNAYVETGDAVTIHDAGLNRSIRLEKRSSLTTVVWNPWSGGAAAFADMDDSEWREFACVEASNILSAGVILQPDQSHIITANITVFTGA
ncbi:D-hexose-6-phosphate mutarotase [Acidicapsa dinghuensis]|uniref:Putative glucose-6-phosphate 1-epimerase n=1 Tax=Acidicapsa dinghuensis TaxID=2218256 RepID=A0ABW1EKD3_9BACT|nr:D-hexose-6-phosphate mutarotase [Acidicapsa dinghuensis]